MQKDFDNLIAFNRGMISPLALARLDFKRVAMSATTQLNWMPRVLGSMMLRPGTEMIGNTASNGRAVMVPFIFNNDQMAVLELTDSLMRVWVDDELVTRIAVSTAVTNGNFTTDLTGWTDSSGGGCSTAWVTGSYMGLTGNGTGSAVRHQTLTVAGGDIGKEHALRFTVARGLVIIRVGTSDGDDSYIQRTELRPGTYSFTFEPAGNIHVQIASKTEYQSLVKSVNIEAAGVFSLPTPWTASDIRNVRWDESADVIFAACNGFQQRRITRYTADSHSWAIDVYEPSDGPFRLPNTRLGETLTVSATQGDITITASQQTFYPTQVGSLFSITSDGQVVTDSLSAQNTFTDPIEVTGVGSSERTFGITITGTWSATVTLQQSIGAPGAWIDIKTWTGNTSESYADGLDNQIIFYRIGIKTGAYTSGTAVLTLTYSSGSITGIARIVKYTDNQHVDAIVLQHFGGTTATNNWSEGSWSDFRGWPTALVLFEGRLWHGGRAMLWGSISDAYESFDDNFVGDAGPISKAIGSGPVDVINWMLPLLRLMLGGEGAEHSVRSSALDTPLTPTNFSIKEPSTQGSCAIPAVRMDQKGLFVDKSFTRLYELSIENAYYSYDYTSADLTTYIPEIGAPGFIRLAIQRKIDTRVHGVRNDGEVGILVYDPLEDVKAWIQFHTQGLVEDVVIMPSKNSTEDQVYYVVSRVINSVTYRFFEKWALESECQGGTLNKQADCHVVYSGSPTTTITASHLHSTAVVVWADGKDLGPQTTDSLGRVFVSSAVSNYVIGLGYNADFESTKLANNLPGGSNGLNQKSRADHLSLVLNNTHYQGLMYGTSFDDLDPLPLVEDGKVTDPDTIWAEYDKISFEMDDIYNEDTRLCLRASAPRPCTVMAAMVQADASAK